MKDQYVGDVSDYLKYATLRAWQAKGLSVGLAWMLTEPDVRSDGRLTRYLARPELYRQLDPELFDALAKLMASGRRSIRAVVDLELVVASFSYDSLLWDGREARDAWFGGLVEHTGAAQILFLDPDNGLEVASLPRGRSGSRRYVYLEELRALWLADQAVVVYQHFPRVAREAYLDAQLRQLAEVWPGSLTFAVCSPRIALLVSVPAAFADTMLDAVRTLVVRDAGGVGARIHLLERA
jgi:hypothetical protein